MNNSIPPENQEDLKETCARLQHQLESTLILTCVISLTLLIYFGVSFYNARKDVQAMRPIIEEYQKEVQPRLQDLSAKLVEYSRTHPDIQPILNKYGVAMPTNSAAAPVKK